MRVYQPHIKIAETPSIKAGTILLSQGFWNSEEFQRSVILILEHDEHGSTGVILNKLSNMKVLQALPGFRVNEQLYYGGPVSTDKVGFIHQYKNISGAVKITNELYWGGNVYQLKNLMEAGEIDLAQVRFFAGLVEWAPGELYHEINNKNWWVDEFSFDEVMENPSCDLWSYKLRQQENLYGLLYEIPDPVLN